MRKVLATAALIIAPLAVAAPVAVITAAPAAAASAPCPMHFHGGNC